jgi:hypothetical protein
MNRISPGARGPIRSLFLLTLSAAILVLVAARPALAADPSPRLERQMQLVERAINEVLVDSPNFLVAGSDVTQSIDDEDGGVLFLFEASLTDPDWDSHGILSNLHLGSGGKSVIVMKRKDGGKDEDSLDLDESEITVKDGQITIRGKDGKELKVFEKDDGESSDKSTHPERQLAKYERAKEELITVLLDYGEFLKALPAGAPVRIVARLHDTGLSKEKLVRKLSVRANVDDLRAYGDGKLSESEMRTRVDVRES